MNAVQGCRRLGLFYFQGGRQNIVKVITEQMLTSSVLVAGSWLGLQHSSQHRKAIHRPSSPQAILKSCSMLPSLTASPSGRQAAHQPSVPSCGTANHASTTVCGRGLCRWQTMMQGHEKLLHI